MYRLFRPYIKDKKRRDWVQEYPHPSTVARHRFFDKSRRNEVFWWTDSDRALNWMPTIISPQTRGLLQRLDFDVFLSQSFDRARINFRIINYTYVQQKRRALLIQKHKHAHHSVKIWSLWLLGKTGNKTPSHTMHNRLPCVASTIMSDNRHVRTWRHIERGLISASTQLAWFTTKNSYADCQRIYVRVLGFRV